MFPWHCRLLFPWHRRIVFPWHCRLVFQIKVKILLTGISISHRFLVCLKLSICTTIVTGSIRQMRQVYAKWRMLIGSLDSALKRTFQESSARISELKSGRRTHSPILAILAILAIVKQIFTLFFSPILLFKCIFIIVVLRTPPYIIYVVYFLHK